MGFKEFRTVFSLILHEFLNVTILDSYAHIICRDGFHKLEKIKDPNRRIRHLKELTENMRECKRCENREIHDDLVQGF